MYFQYFYLGIDQNNTLIKSSTLARNKAELQKFLQIQNIALIKITKRKFYFSKITQKEIINFWQKLKSFEQSAVPLLTSLEIMQKK